MMALSTETDDRWHKARQTLTDEGVERLAEILADGSTPTCGFFLRYRLPKQ